MLASSFADVFMDTMWGILLANIRAKLIASKITLPDVKGSPPPICSDKVFVLNNTLLQHLHKSEISNIMHYCNDIIHK